MSTKIEDINAAKEGSHRFSTLYHLNTRSQPPNTFFFSSSLMNIPNTPISDTPDDNEDQIAKTLAALVGGADEYSPKESSNRRMSFGAFDDAIRHPQTIPPPVGSNRPSSVYISQARPTETYPPRPASEIFAGKWAGLGTGVPKPPEQEVVDKWFETIAQYEQQLQEMSRTPIDDNFKEELRAIEHWFTVLTEAEKTAAMYTLLRKSSPVQVRFFMNVLQHMAMQDPVAQNLTQDSWPRRPERPESQYSRTSWNRKSAVGEQRNSVASMEDAFSRLSVPGYDGDRSRFPIRERPASFHEAASSLPRNSRPPSFHERPSSFHEASRPRAPSVHDRPSSLEDRRSSIPSYYYHEERRHSPFEPTSKRNSAYIEDAWQKQPRGQNARTFSTPSINVYTHPSPVITPRSTSLVQPVGSTSSGSVGLESTSFGSDKSGQIKTSPGMNANIPPISPAMSATSDHDHPDEFSVDAKYGKTASKGKPEKFDVQQLSDIQAWLRSLRLHKYGPQFEGISWKEMIRLTDEQLEQRGVQALGARRKLLKVFELVRAELDKQGVPY